MPAAAPQKKLSEDKLRLRELNELLRKSAGPGLRRLTPAQLERLPQLYRFTSSLIARLETQRTDGALLAEARRSLIEAHSLLYRDVEDARGSFFLRAYRYVAHDVPRALRAEWRLLLTFFVLLYGLATTAYFAVLNDLEMAYSLMDPGMVSQEISQLRATEDGAPFRGNFTFGMGESPTVSGWIMLHNMTVGVLFFAAALVPPLFLYVFSANSLMLGTYTGVAAHWDQAGAISSILWCHGTLEIQAIVIAGAAGITLVRGVVAPGPWTRRHALAREGRQALKLLSATFPMLFFAGLIEGFISPHATLSVRMTTAVVSGLLFLGWMLLGGRRRTERTEPARS